jgi:transcriptional regulator with XRE-family HTH domain
MSDFYTLRKEAGLSRANAAELFEVSKRTIKNWDKDNKPPKAVFLYLHVLTGRLDHLGPDWKGFRFAGNCIESPEGEFIYAWEIRAMRYLLQAAGLSHTKLYHIMQQRTRPERPEKAEETRKIITLKSPKSR